MLQILYFIIYNDKIDYVFVIDNKFFTLETTLNNNDLLSKEVNFQAKIFDKSVVIYINAFFLNYEEQKIFKKSYLILSKSIIKIYINVFDFKEISINVAETLKIQIKNENIINIVNSIETYKSISSFFNNKTRLDINNLKNINRVTIVISIYFLQKSLLLRVQLISFSFILINIKEFLKQTRRRD